MRWVQCVRLRISTAASVFLGWKAGVYQSIFELGSFQGSSRLIATMVKLWRSSQNCLSKLRMDSARTDLARRVLKALADGHPVPTHDALQLRNWAVRPEDILLPLEEIASGMLEPGRQLKLEGGSCHALRRKSQTCRGIPSGRSRILARNPRAYRKRTTSALSEHKRLREMANNVSIKCQEAHLAIERHVAEHGC